MFDLGVLGLVWGTGLFATWAGYYLVYMPKKVKNWILRNKFRVLALDMFLIVMGNQILSKATGTVVAGIGTMFFGLMCFTFSLTMLGFAAYKNRKQMKGAAYA